MRVLYVLRYYPTLTETFVYREAMALQRRGVSVDAVAWGSRADGALQDQLPTWSVTRPPRGLRALSLVPALRHLAGSSGRAAFTSIPRAKDGLRALWLADLARGYDRVHAHFAGEAAEVAAAAAALAGKPFSVTVHAVDLWKPRPSLEAVLRAARPAIAVCADGQREIARLGVKAALVRVGVDPEGPLATPDAPGPLRVIAVGRDVPKKGFDALRRVVARAGFPIDLQIVSDSPPSQVRARLAGAHVFALPCRVAPDGDRDGVPVAVLEAMAAGLPVIAGAAGGVPEVVDERVGWLVPADDDALLDALASASADPAERARRGSNGRQRILDGLTLDHQRDALLAAWAS